MADGRQWNSPEFAKKVFLKHDNRNPSWIGARWIKASALALWVTILPYPPIRAPKPNLHAAVSWRFQRNPSTGLGMPMSHRCLADRNDARTSTPVDQVGRCDFAGWTASSIFHQTARGKDSRERGADEGRSPRVGSQNRHRRSTKTPTLTRVRRPIDRR